MISTWSVRLSFSIVFFSHHRPCYSAAFRQCERSHPQALSFTLVDLFSFIHSLFLSFFFQLKKPTTKTKSVFSTFWLAFLQGRILSKDLFEWENQGSLLFLDHAHQGAERPLWSSARFGAPFVWQCHDDEWWMVVMGESDIKTHRSSLGLFRSKDGLVWEPLPSKDDVTTSSDTALQR